MTIHKVLIVDDSKTETLFMTDLLQRNPDPSEHEVREGSCDPVEGAVRRHWYDVDDVVVPHAVLDSVIGPLLFSYHNSPHPISPAGSDP